MLFDDVRRVYELEACKELGFTIIYVEATDDIRRQRAEAQGLAFIENHNSETEIEGLREHADFVVVNNGDDSGMLETMARHILEFLRSGHNSQTDGN